MTVPFTRSIDLRHARTAAAALLVASVAACSAAAGPSPTPGSTGGPGTGPSPTPVATTGGFEHPTGAKDVVLRFEESGGFVPVEVNATYAPSFTLYGDGTVVFRDPYAVPPATTDSIQRGIPFMTIKLDEDGIQALLEEALNVGGLAVATGPYTSGMVADIPTATFTISLGGKTKMVSVTGLSPDVQEPQNRAIVTQLAAFAEKLRTFGDLIGGEQQYAPAAYRGILFEVEQPFGPVVDWPWTDLTPADFANGDNELFRTRAMTRAEVDELGIEGIEGGMTGVAVQSEGSLYTFSLRPLLPDES